MRLKTLIYKELEDLNCSELQKQVMNVVKTTNNILYDEKIYFEIIPILKILSVDQGDGKCFT